jgi:3-oxoacyl-[acyl-carrier protein] reductase
VKAQLVWLTGASSGIGLTIAQHLVSQGGRVHGMDKHASTLSHSSYTHRRVDLSDADAVAAMLAEQHGESQETPTALIHAAGLLHTAKLGALDAAAGEQMWRVHVQAASQLANHVLPLMQAAGAGRVVLIGSRVSGGMPGRSQYAASKAALISLMRSWGAEVIASGVTVNMISPAATDTPMLQGTGRTSSTPRLPPLGRLIKPQEVAELAAYLLSDAAAAITGQDIAICGGASLPR